MNLLMIRLIIVELQFVRLSVGRFGVSGQNLQDPQSIVPTPQVRSRAFLTEGRSCGSRYNHRKKFCPSCPSW